MHSTAKEAIPFHTHDLSKWNRAWVRKGTVGLGLVVFEELLPYHMGRHMVELNCVLPTLKWSVSRRRGKGKNMKN